MSTDQKLASNSDRWVKCISTQGNIRGVALFAKNLVQLQADQHKLRGDSISRLGEALMGGLFLASYCKKGERINLNIQSTGRYKQALVDAYPDGSVRGFLVERESPEDLTQDDQGPWGSGTLSALKTKDLDREKPYIGTVPILTGHLAKDLSFYWVQSEQIPTAVGLAVQVKNKQVVAAGGFLIQALPGASTDEIRGIEEHIRELDSFTKQISQIENPTQLLSHLFQNTAFMVVEEKPITFKCSCSWEKVRRALGLVGAEELASMLADPKISVVRCDFCAHEYEIDRETIRELLEAVRPQGTDKT
ncbi:MAG: Hsp33 family molecular chaperone HslO [Bdellovibrio sp.]|nr:Hsp33 family molecular chaperone HslO [Bdellovibrio sp.]